ncbi:MAG: dihydrodipicolinate synthase family protein [Candidatus Bathyarchaeia archaeon]
MQDLLRVILLRNLKSLRGIVPSLHTITSPNGELSEEDIRSEVRFNIECGVHGLAAGLGAGEFYKFSDEERKKLFEIVVDEANGKVPVLIGAWHTGTEPALMLAKYAEDIVADGVILVPPFFNRVESKLCLYEHFSRIAGSISIPVMIQDNEDAFGVHICPSLYKRLVEENPNIYLAKIEGAGTLEKIRVLKEMLGDRIAIFGGSAARLFYEEMALGASGNIPDACLPDLLVDVFNKYESGDAEGSKKTYERFRRWLNFLLLHPLQAAEIEKETLRLRGVIRCSHTRGPKIGLSEEDKQVLKRILEEICVI